MVVHAVAGARVYLAVLRPPSTPCPLCLSLRIRASRPREDLSAFPLDVLLGTSDGSRWPSDVAAAGAIAHQAVRSLADPVEEQEPASLVEFNLDTFERVLHPVLHTPFCPACGHTTAAPPLPRLSEESEVSPAESWRRMQRAVDPLTGIFAGVKVVEPAAEDATVDGFAARITGGTDTRLFSRVRALTTGSATKHDRLGAQVCALGEGLERYSAGVYDVSRLVRASLNELGRTAVDPRQSAPRLGPGIPSFAGTPNALPVQPGSTHRLGGGS